jgi:hypothetical protein
VGKNSREAVGESDVIAVDQASPAQMIPLLGLRAVTETLQRLVDEDHPEIEIAAEWLYGLFIDKEMALYKFIPPDMQLMLDLHGCWSITDTPRYFDAILKIRVDKVIKRVYRIVGHIPLTNTWTARWPD